MTFRTFFSDDYIRKTINPILVKQAERFSNGSKSIMGVKLACGPGTVIYWVSVDDFHSPDDEMKDINVGVSYKKIGAEDPAIYVRDAKWDAKFTVTVDTLDKCLAELFTSAD